MRRKKIELWMKARESTKIGNKIEGILINKKKIQIHTNSDWILRPQSCKIPKGGGGNK